MRLPASPIVRSAASALVAASFLTATPIGPAHADIGKLLPQTMKYAPDPKALDQIKDDAAAPAADADVKINLNKQINIAGLVTGVNPLDPVGSITKITSALPKSIGTTLPVVNIPLRVDISINVAKATPADVAASDVVIDLPKDLKKAASLASAGDINLALVSGGKTSRLDIDIDTPRKGEADIAIVGKVVPKLPLAKTAGFGRFCSTCGNGQEISDWFVVKNLKNDVSFYTNLVTGVSQFNTPPGFR